MLLLTLFACFEEPAPPRALVESVGTATHSAVVWNGFSHLWGYNHRINSLGDYVRPAACDEDGVCAAEVVHVAASGSGSDEATWGSRYTAVDAPGVTFLGGTARIAIEIEDAEGQLVAFTTDVVVPAAALGDADDIDVHALLNGFDLFATEDADKLQHLALRVGTPARAGDDLVVPVDVSLLLDCDSVECDGTFQTDEDVRYELLVSWLLVAGAPDDVAVRHQTVDTSYEWQNDGLRDEVQLSERDFYGAIVGTPRDYAVGFMGVTGLALELDRDHHMAEWASAVTPARYDAYTGSMLFDGLLAFKQWNAGTWWNPVSYTAPGSAAMELDLALVQLGQGCVRQGEATGTIAWKANGGPASEAAVDTRTVRIPDCG